MNIIIRGIAISPTYFVIWPTIFVLAMFAISPKYFVMFLKSPKYVGQCVLSPFFTT